jgi:hypothetical protein
MDAIYRVCRRNDANLSNIKMCVLLFLANFANLVAVNVKVCRIKAMWEIWTLQMYQTASISAGTSDIVFLRSPPLMP